MIRAAEATRHAVIVAFWAVLTPRQILFLQTLKEEGWRITVLAWDREGSGKGPVLPEGLVDELRLMVLHAPAWSLRLLASLPRYYVRLLREVGRIPGRPMWILTHFLHLPNRPLPSRARALRRCRDVRRRHGLLRVSVEAARHLLCSIVSSCCWCGAWTV